MNTMIGHNSATAVTLDGYSRGEIVARIGDVADRLEELAAAEIPQVIADAETKGNAADWVKIATATLKAAESKRVDEKSPLLVTGKLVDGVFSALTGPVEAKKSAILTLITRYDAAERARIQREAQIAADAERKRVTDALAASKAAEQAGLADAAAEALDDAVAADVRVREHVAITQTSTADLTKSRSAGLGALSTTRSVWVGEITNRDEIDLLALRPYLSVEMIERALGQFVRAGGRTLSGARIYQKESTVVT